MSTWVSFFQKVRFVSKTNYSKSLSWAWNYLNKLFTVMGGNFSFQVEDSDLEYFLEIWRFEKTNRTFWKKPPMNMALLEVNKKGFFLPCVQKVNSGLTFLDFLQRFVIRRFSWLKFFNFFNLKKYQKKF